MLGTWPSPSGQSVRGEGSHGAGAVGKVGSRKKYVWVLLGWKDLAWFKVVEKESKLRRENGLERKRWPSPGREKMLFSPRRKGGRTGCLGKLLGLQVALMYCQEAFLTKT